MTAPPEATVCASAAPVRTLLPTGRDAELVGARLASAGIVCERCDSIAQLIERHGGDDGPLLIADEALSDDDGAALTTRLHAQPDWSELPVILLVRSSGLSPAVAELSARPGVAILRRPVSRAALLSIVRSAVEARRRQLAVRDLLETLRRMTRRLERRRDELQRLSRKLMTAEERERRRIAEDVHDNLGQLLNLAKMRLAVLRPRVDADATHELEQVEAVLRQASDATRSLTRRLAPPILYELGLDAALEWLVDEIDVLAGLRVRLALDGGAGEIAEEMRISLYRATRELLLNVARHAKVEEASLTVRREADTLHIIIEDRGVGFRPSATDDREDEGFGLFSVRERVAAFGGELRIRSVVGEGTSAEIIIGVGEPKPETAREASS